MWLTVKAGRRREGDVFGLYIQDAICLCWCQWWFMRPSCPRKFWISHCVSESTSDVTSRCEVFCGDPCDPMPTSPMQLWSRPGKLRWWWDVGDGCNKSRKNRASSLLQLQSRDSSIGYRYTYRPIGRFKHLHGPPSRYVIRSIFNSSVALYFRALCFIVFVIPVRKITISLSLTEVIVFLTEVWKIRPWTFNFNFSRSQRRC